MLQSKLASLDVQCEDMCRRLGIYPNCQCPGFAGNPSSDGDTRRCMKQHCQDPQIPCPTPAFVTCVEESTKISALQWGALFQQLDSSLDAFNNMVAKAGNMRR